MVSTSADAMMAARFTREPTRSTIVSQLPRKAPAMTNRNVTFDVRCANSLHSTARDSAQCRVTMPRANGMSCSAATVFTRSPTGNDTPSPRAAPERMALAVGAKVMLPMTARSTCSTAPVCTSAFAVMTSLAPNGAPGALHSSAMATNAGVASDKSSAVPHPMRGRTTNATTRIAVTRRTLLSALVICSKVVLNPAFSIVVTMKTASTVLKMAWVVSMSSCSLVGVAGSSASGGDPREGVVVGPPEGGADSFVAEVEVGGVDNVGDSGHLELFLDAFADRCEHELAVGRGECGGVTVQDLHERRAHIGAATEAEDDDRSRRVGAGVGEHRLDHRGSGEEQASVGLQDHDLVRCERHGWLGLDEVSVGVEHLAADGDLGGLAHDVEHDREPDTDEHGVLQRDEHRQPERDGQHRLLDDAGLPDSGQAGGLDGADADQDQQSRQCGHGDAADGVAEHEDDHGHDRGGDEQRHAGPGAGLFVDR